MSAALALFSEGILKSENYSPQCNASFRNWVPTLEQIS